MRTFHHLLSTTFTLERAFVHLSALDLVNDRNVRQNEAHILLCDVAIAVEIIAEKTSEIRN